jgi:diguanylate cyclase (GGDEF)-like protein/PAS domain S-box-containing protein
MPQKTRNTHKTESSDKRRSHLEDLLEFSPVGIFWIDSDGHIESLNQPFTELFGYQPADLPDLNTWGEKAYPDTDYRRQVFAPWLRQVENNPQAGEILPELESTIVCKDHSFRRVICRIRWSGDLRLAFFTDITEPWQSQQRNRTHGEILEMIARAEPLHEILTAIVTEIEAEEAQTFASVLLLDKDGKHLHTAAAPRLPVFYSDAINGLEIGMGVGSCGTAAFLGERVIVEDISTHDYWKRHKDLAKKAGLASCWSEPINSSDGKVLGTFAIYHGFPAAPTDANIQLIALAANLAAIAIESRNTREALIQHERKFRTLAENAPINIARYDLQGHLLYANPRLVGTFRAPLEQLVGKRLSHLPGMDIFLNAVAKTVETGEEQQFEVEVPDADGQTKIHLISMVTERDHSGAITGVLTTGLDISDHKRLEQQLELQAHVDFLTELLNRRHFIELAAQELLRLDRYGGALSLILFDIDFFKKINDTYGHSNGDRVLKEIAHITKGAVRETDIPGRFGGEEFVVLLPHTDRQEAAEVAERLRHTIDDAKIYLDNEQAVQFTASLGVATTSKDKDQKEKKLSIDDLLQSADSAMYQAKSGGRNRVCIADDG